MTKPLAPPWDDSGKNFPRDLALSLPQVRFHVLVPRGVERRVPNWTEEPVYSGSGGYKPSKKENARVLLRLLRPDGHIGIYHFFFAPNPLTSKAARVALRLKPSKRSVQTILSRPTGAANLRSLIFADVSVTLSDHGRDMLINAGVESVRRIYPGLDIEAWRSLPAPDWRAELGAGPEDFIVLYPGDLFNAQVEDELKQIVSGLVGADDRIRAVIASRPKVPEDEAVKRGLQSHFAALRGGDRVHFLDKVEGIRGLVAASDVVLFPVLSMKAKMDLPMILLEAMAEGKPLVIYDMPPVNELFKSEIGIRVGQGDRAAVVDAVLRLKASDSERAAMGAAARSVIETHFTIGRMAREYLEVYESLIGR